METTTSTGTAAEAVAETRIKVTSKQAEALVMTRQLVDAARAHLAEQEQKAQIAQALVFEFYEIPDGTDVAYDPEHRELVFRT